MQRIRRYARLALLIIAGMAVLTLWGNYLVTRASAPYVTSDIDEVRPTKVGLVLGASRNLQSGERNTFFFNRTDAAVELFEAGKIEYIIVSGDNSHAEYNEPQDMKEELVKRGVPESRIFLDYAGFRTLDSVIRAHEIFGQDTFVVVSQKFHNERAVLLARKSGIAAYGYNAKEVDAAAGFSTKLREYLARDKMFIDLLLRVEPKFGGEKIVIE